MDHGSGNRLARIDPQDPNATDAWAIGVQRIVPTVGLQAFTQPATVVPRGEGFALLMFK